MGVPYSIFCCFKSTTNARLLDLEDGGTGTYSTDVNTMLASADNAGIRTSIGLGATNTPTFAGVTAAGSAFSNFTLGVSGGGRSAALSLNNGGNIGGLGIASNYVVAWSSANSSGPLGNDAGNFGNLDLFLTREAGGILAQRNLNTGGATQAFRLYNGTDSTAGGVNPTNFDRASFSFTSGNFRIAAENSNTGAYTTARGIDFATGGAVRMSIAAAGNLGVGISAPVAKLDVLFPTSSTGLNLASNAATSVSNFLTWYTAWGTLSGGIKSSDVGGGWNTQIYSSSKISLSAGGADSPDLTIDSTGNVGIGTTTPASGLHVSGALGGNVTTFDSAAALRLTNSTDGSSWLLTAGIIGVVNGSFSIRQGGTSLTALAISNTGNVGIGLNTSPAAKLHITGGDTNLGFASASIALGLGTTGTYPHFIHTRHNASLLNNAIDFYTCDGNAGGAFPANAIHGLTINNGSVGIGTTNPVAKLDTAETWNAPALAVTGASGTGTTATITFAAQLTPIPVGSTIVVAGVTPSGYNGTFVVTGSTTSTVLYANATTGAGTGGTIERVFTSIKLNVTDTASNAASKLMDLQVGGVSKFNVEKTGSLNIANGSFLLRDNVSGCNEFRFLNNGLVFRAVNEALVLKMNIGGMWAHTDKYIGFGNAGGTLPDTTLFQDAPGILAQRNGSATQAFRVYNTYTDASNYQRLSFGFASGVAQILSSGAGASGHAALTLGTGSGTWQFTTAGNFIALADNTYDIGASGTNRPRNLYVAGNAVFGTNTGVSTATPLNVSFGGTYGTAVPGSDSNLKWDMYNSGSGDRYGIGMSIYLMEFQAGIGAGFGFYPNSGTTSALHILSTGNVGIGTTTPASKLQVTAGDIEVETVTNGIILKAAGTSTRYRLTLNAGGTALVFTAV